MKSVSPAFRLRRDSNAGTAYLFLPASCLAAAACFFFWSALLALACFCEDFF